MNRTSWSVAARAGDLVIAESRARARIVKRLFAASAVLTNLHGDRFIYLYLYSAIPLFYGYGLCVKRPGGRGDIVITKIIILLRP